MGTRRMTVLEDFFSEFLSYVTSAPIIESYTMVGTGLTVVNPLPRDTTLVRVMRRKSYDTDRTFWIVLESDKWVGDEEFYLKKESTWISGAMSARDLPFTLSFHDDTGGLMRND